MKSLNFAEVYNMLGGITEWAATHPVVVPTTPPTTTKTIQPTAVTTMTQTATLLTTNTQVTIDEPITYSVVDLFVPEHTPSQDPFPILITLTNTGGSQVSCDIPIIIQDIDVPTDIVTWMISVTLDAGETSEILVEGLFINIDKKENEGYYKVSIGSKGKIINVG